jgi:hypothetical protein
MIVDVGKDPKQEEDIAEGGSSENKKIAVEGEEPKTDEGVGQAEKPVFAPSICWKLERVSVDLKLATKLIKK